MSTSYSSVSKKQTEKKTDEFEKFVKNDMEK